MSAHRITLLDRRVASKGAGYSMVAARTNHGVMLLKAMKDPDDLTTGIPPSDNVILLPWQAARALAEWIQEPG